MAGMQGIGVKTPIAADVAEATVGFANDVHIPKGKILIIGLKSVMVPMGLFANITRLSGRTTNLDGAIPKEHCKVAVEVTYEGIAIN
jgi:hypothetical protein